MDNKVPEEISFGQWLHQRRRMLDLTQQELADQVGCARITLRRMESGALRPSKELALILLEKLNVPSEEHEAWLRFARGLSGFPERSGDSSASKPITNLPTGTVTFLFTDIEGSTQLWEQSPEAMKAAHARHESIIREAVAAHGGYTYKMIGDAFQVAFATAPEALAAALDTQRALHAEPWAETGPIRVRMALHTGVTEERGDDYVGPVLNRVARLLGAGYGGQVLLSQSAYDLVYDTLPRDVSLQDLGERRLKDLVRPEHIYQLIAPGLPSDYPPLKTDTFPHNLPAQVTSFIGRDKELDEIMNLIARNRLVTLTGAGGIGKTRLSIQVASSLLNDYPNGTWLVELAPLSDPTLVPQAIVNTLGLIEQAGRPPLTVLTDFLQDKHTLLILDNCEHLIQACAQLAEALLHACPDLHILATSREALEISGETLYHVPSLITPELLNITFDILPQYEAVQLFVERAQSAMRDFSLTEANAHAIAQVCHNLDGIPLALELAAARVKVLRVEEIAVRLDDRFHLLTGGARTAMPRHQTLQAMIDWSHDLLTEPERVLFRRLSIFAGGWTLEAEERVAGNRWHEKIENAPAIHELQTADVLDLLTSLVNKSLISVESKPGQETRYTMLETIRQYASEKLWQAGEGELLCRRHLAYYVDLAERAEPNLRAPTMVMWLDRLEAEHENIRSALEWALEGDIEAELRLASALLWFWHIRGHKNEGVEWLERALSIEAMDQDGQPRTPSRAMLRGKALNASGSLMVMNQEIGRAPVRLEESLALFKELGAPGKQGMAYALLRLALLPSARDRAKGMLLQSLAWFREIGDKFGVTETLMQLSGVVQNDDHQQAVLFVEEKLALSREIGDQDGIASALSSLADLALARDEYQQAIPLYAESLAGARTVKNLGAVSMTLGSFGDVFFWQGNYQRAAKTYEEALAFVQEHGYPFHIAFYFYSLGILAWFQGEYSHAIHQVSSSHPIFRDIGHHWLAVSSLHTLGDIALAEGDVEEAVQWYEDELKFSQKIQLEAPHIFAIEGLAKVAWAKGDYDLAVKGSEESLSMSQKADIRHATFHSLLNLGRVAQSRGDYGKARTFYIEALKLQKRRVSPLFNWVWLKTYITTVSYPLEGLAILACAQNQMGRAARLIGAAENFYAPIRFEMSAKERAEHDQAIAAARAALGEEAFTVAWAEGKAMTMKQAVTYALGES